ncbi:MAG: glycosyltransferase [Chloroflexota bacterium]|nr:MAG: glycosyltransferase [Chloroflexota bacterium]
MVSGRSHEKGSGASSMPKKVLIAGYHGFGNTGDETILTAMLQSLRASEPTLELVVVSGSPEMTAARHSVRSVLWTDLPAIVAAAEECDLVILGGGGIFQNYRGRSITASSLLSSFADGQIGQRAERENEIGELQAQSAVQNRRIATLQGQLAERENEIGELRAQIESVERSFGWGLLQLLWRTGSWLAPRGTLRYRAFYAMILTQWVLRTEGVGAAWRAARSEAWRGPGAAMTIHSRQEERLSRELQAIIAQHESALETVIFLPSVEWNISLFQRPQQLSLALARQNCLVLFCEPWNPGARSIGFHRLDDRLYTAHVPLRVLKGVRSPVAFTLVYNGACLSELDSARVVYEHIDELDVSLFPGDIDALERDHVKLLREATYVVATAEKLLGQVSELRPDALLCPNGVDYHLIRRTIDETTKPPDDLKPLLKDASLVVGYYGALAEWFDYDLLARAAAERPHYRFVLIGPDYDGSIGKSSITKLENISWLGPKPYPDVARYLKYFDVATIPFKLNDITHAVSPLKLFEYMAGRKPVVTTDMRECRRYPGVLIGGNPREFIKRLDEALARRDDHAYLAQVDQVARDNSWDVRAQAILQLIRSGEGS